MKVEQKQEGSCVVCQKLTKFICMDCATDNVKFIPLCDDPQCIKNHKSTHDKVVENLVGDLSSHAREEKRI